MGRLTHVTRTTQVTPFRSTPPHALLLHPLSTIHDC